MPLLPIDVLLGRQHVIELAFIFPGRIEVPALRSSFAALCAKYPVLMGRMRRSTLSWKGCASNPTPLHGWELRCDDDEHATPCDDALLPLQVRRCGGSCLDVASSSHVMPSDFMQSAAGASAIMGGRAPPMMASLTHFDGGGSALGVRLSHGVTDAAGLYRLLFEWSRLHAGRTASGGCDDDRDGLVFQRDEVRSTIMAHVRAADEERQLGNHHQQAEDRRNAALTAVDLRTWSGSALYRLMGALATPPQLSTPRLHLSLSLDEVDELRSTCRHAGASRRPSANEALVASLSRVATRMLRLPATARCQLQMVFDVRRAARLPQGFVGNAFHSLDSAPTAAAPHAMPIAELCAIVRELAQRPFAEAANSYSNPASLKGGWLWMMAMLERGRLPSASPHATDAHEYASQPAAVSHKLLANYQAHFPAEKLMFGDAGGACIRVVPGLGDHLQMVPRPRGGVDVYLNLGAPRASLASPTPTRGAGKQAPPHHALDWEARLRDAVLDPRL